MLNLLDVVVFESRAEVTDSFYLFVIFVYLGLTGVRMVHFGGAEHTCKDHVDQDVFGLKVAAIWVVLEWLIELLKSLSPPLFSHVHFASALLNDAHDTWVRNYCFQVHRFWINFLKPLFIFHLMAHLDFESKSLEEQVALWLIELLCIFSGGLDLVWAWLRLAATVLEDGKQVIKLLVAMLFKINFSKSQANRMPQFFVLSL